VRKLELYDNATTLRGRCIWRRCSRRKCSRRCKKGSCTRERSSARARCRRGRRCKRRNHWRRTCRRRNYMEKSDEAAQRVAKFYSLNSSSLISNRKVLASQLKTEEEMSVLKSTSKLISWLDQDGIGKVLPTYVKAANILGAIPATSCSAERSFSALRKIKTYLRNTMAQDRLDSVAIIHIEIEISLMVENNKMDDIINKFAGRGDRAKYMS
jgi:hypothetical protein